MRLEELDGFDLAVGGHGADNIAELDAGGADENVIVGGPAYAEDKQRDCRESDQGYDDAPHCAVRA